MTGYLMGGSQQYATLTLVRSMADSHGDMSPYVGKYTIIIKPDPLDNNAPHGNGFASLSVSATGAIKLTGKLGDGTSITEGTVLTQDATWMLYVPLYRKTGSIYGTVIFDLGGSSSSDMDATLSWTKPNSFSDHPTVNASAFRTISNLGNSLLNDTVALANGGISGRSTEISPLSSALPS